MDRSVGTARRTLACWVSGARPGFFGRRRYRRPVWPSHPWGDFLDCSEHQRSKSCSISGARTLTGPPLGRAGAGDRIARRLFAGGTASPVSSHGPTRRRKQPVALQLTCPRKTSAIGGNRLWQKVSPGAVDEAAVVQSRPLSANEKIAGPDETNWRPLPPSVFAGPAVFAARNLMPWRTTELPSTFIADPYSASVSQHLSAARLTSLPGYRRLPCRFVGSRFPITALWAGVPFRSAIFTFHGSGALR